MQVYFGLKVFRPHTHTQSEIGATSWPTPHRSVSPLARSLNVVAVEATTAADYRIFLHTKWSHALSFCPEYECLKAQRPNGRSVKTQTAATPKCPGQAGRTTGCSCKKPDEGRRPSHMCTLQKDGSPLFSPANHSFQTRCRDLRKYDFWRGSPDRGGSSLSTLQ